MSLSDSLVFNPKPSAVTSSRLRSNFPCYNSATATPGSTSMINIACGRRGQYLSCKQSFLKFQLNNLSSTVGDKIAVDYSASSLIQRIDVYHASTLLESISEYGALYTLMQDMQGYLEAQRYAGNILEGIDGATARVGADIPGGSARSPATSLTFCIPLLLGTLGCLQSKYLPLGAMSAGDLRLEVTWANANDGVHGTNANSHNWNISNIEYVAEIVEINSEAQGMIEQANSAGYTLSYDSFFNHANSIENGSSGVTMLIPCKYQSLKTLFTIFRKQSNVGLNTAKVVSERVNPIGTGSLYYSIAGHNVPATPVRSSAEAYAELCKSMHSFSSVDNAGMMKLADYTSSSAGTFAIGIDLETLSHKSKITDSGINTVGATTLLNASFSTAITTPLRVDSWSHFDGWLIIQNGQAQPRY
jgi:hypothetical protein